MQGDSCHIVQSETIPQLGIILPDVKWSCFRPSWLGRVLAEAQPERPIRVTTHRFGSSPHPAPQGRKRTGRGAVRAFPVCSWFSVPAHRSWFLSARPPLCLAWDQQSARSPADSALLHRLAADSTHPPDPVCQCAYSLLTPPFSTHWLLTPPFSTHWLLTPPKVLPSHLTVAPHSLNRRFTARSGR